MNLHNIIVAAAGNPVPLGTESWVVNTAKASYVTCVNTCWSGQKFFAICGTGTTPPYTGQVILSSSDGVTWSSASAGVGTGFPSDVYSVNNIVIAYGYNSTAVNKVKTSVDSGATYSQVTLPFTPYSSYTNRVGYINGTFILLSSVGSLSNTRIAYSNDGITWSTDSAFIASAPLWSKFVSTLTYTYCISTTRTVVRTLDGVTWENIGTCPVTCVDQSYRASNIAWNGSVLCAVQYSDRTVATSSDGITWTTNTNLNTALGGTGTIRTVVFDGSVFLAFGTSGIMATSPDGITWTARTSLSSSSWGTNNVGAAVWNGEQVLVLSYGGANILAAVEA